MKEEHTISKLSEKFSYRDQTTDSSSKRFNVIRKRNLRQRIATTCINKATKTESTKVKTTSINELTLSSIAVDNVDADEQIYLPLPDLFSSNLEILFIGYNPSLRSSLIRHRYAHPTNSFWRLLHQSGLTKRQLQPKDDESLRQSYGYGFTELCRRPTRNIADLNKLEMTEGVKDLVRNVNRWKPKIVCCVGKGVFENILKGSNIKRKAFGVIQWGNQGQIECLTGAEEVLWFVLPCTSGLVRLKKDEVLKIWKELHSLVRNKIN